MNATTIRLAIQFVEALQAEGVNSGDLPIGDFYFYFGLQPVGLVCKRCKKRRG